MQGDIGSRRLDGAGLTVGHIEEERRADDAPPEHIQAAAVERLTMVLRVAFVTEGGFFPHAGRLVGIDCRAAEPFGEQASGSQSHVPDHRRGHSESRPPAKSAIFRIPLPVFRRALRRLPVGAAHRRWSGRGLLHPSPIPRTRWPASRAVRDVKAVRLGGRSLRKSSPGRRRRTAATIG